MSGVLLALLVLSYAHGSRIKAPNEVAGVWDSAVDPEAYYNDEDFFSAKVPTAMPPSALMNGPITKTFFLEKKVQLSQKGMEGWMDAHFADQSTVQKLQSRGPKANPVADHTTTTRVFVAGRRVESGASPTTSAKNFRFKATGQAKQKKVMPPVAGIMYNGDPRQPCPGAGISNAYFGAHSLQPLMYPDHPCYNLDFVTPYYTKPIQPLMPELQVGMQSPPVNFYSDGSRYPKDMRAYDHFMEQGLDTGLTPNSPQHDATGGAAGGKGAVGGKGGKG